MTNPLLALLENDKKKKAKKAAQKTSAPKVEEKKFVSQVSRGSAREVFSENFSLRAIREQKQKEREQNKKEIAALVAAKNEKIEKMDYLTYHLLFKSKPGKNKSVSYVKGRFNRKAHGFQKGKAHQSKEAGKIAFAQNSNWYFRAENARKYKRLMREESEVMEFVQYVNARKK